VLGFGKSASLPYAFSVDDYALWLKDFLVEQKIENPHVICHSFGARVLLKALYKGYFSVDKIVITGGAGIVKKRTPSYKFKVWAYRTVKKVFPKFAERHFGSEEYRSLSPIMKESYKKIVNEDLSHCASKIKNKTLLVYGKKDKTTPINEEGQTFNTLIKNSTLVALDGGHFCFCDEYLKFNETVRGFLTE